MIDVDIPQLSSRGIYFGIDCFDSTYSLKSSSTHSPISSSFDATGIENYLSFRTMEPSSASTVVRNRTELNSIPLNVEDLWIGRFDTSDVSEFSPNRFQTLKTLVIGNCLFWSVNRLELNNLPSLQSIDIGEYCFFLAPSFSLTGLIDVDIPQLSSSGIRFGNCFKYTYSLQSSSTHSLISSSFDATALESAIRSKSKYV